MPKDSLNSEEKRKEWMMFTACSKKGLSRPETKKALIDLGQQCNIIRAILDHNLYYISRSLVWGEMNIIIGY